MAYVIYDLDLFHRIERYQSGIERAINFLIPGLFILLIGLAVYASSLSGFEEAMSYLFIADFEKLDNSVTYQQ